MPHEKALISQSTENDHANSQSQLADYYQWVEPDREIRIYVNFETADRLQVEALRGLDSEGRVEVGGILLGRTAVDGGRITAIIDDFEPVPCAYPNGPFYSPARVNAANFKTALERRKSDVGAGLSIVGYYRSHRRDDLYLSADDLTLIQNFFPGIDNVFLLIKPLPMRACTAGFFFWEDGKIQSEFTLEVPFAPIKSPFPTSSEADIDIIDDLLLPERLDLSADLTTIPSGRERWHGRPRDVAAVTLGIALSLGIFGYWQVRRPQIKRPNVSNLAPVAQNLTSSVQPAPIPAVTPSGEVRAATPSREVKTALVTNPRQQIVIPSHTSPLQESAYQQDVSRTAVSGMAAVSGPAGPPIPTAGDGKLEPPPSLLNETKIGELAVAPTRINPPPAVQNAAPLEILPPRTEPVSPAPQTAVSPAEPEAPARQASKTSFVGPQVIYRVNPAIPLAVRPLITGETQIDVTVRIDSAGKVTDAQVTSSRGAAARLVAAEAIKAARSFRFQPARENDGAVQSRMILTFRFK